MVENFLLVSIDWTVHVAAMLATACLVYDWVAGAVTE